MERDLSSIPNHERQEVSRVRDVLERYLNPQNVLQNVVVKGPGNSNKKRQLTLTEVDLFLSTGKNAIIVEIGAEKEEPKPDMFSRKFYHLSKARKIDEISFLEFNGGLLRGIETRKYNSLSSDSPDIIVGIGSVYNVEELSYRQVFDKIKELEMKSDIPLGYYQELIKSSYRSVK